MWGRKLSTCPSSAVFDEFAPFFRAALVVIVAYCKAFDFEGLTRRRNSAAKFWNIIAGGLANTVVYISAIWVITLPKMVCTDGSFDCKHTIGLIWIDRSCPSHLCRVSAVRTVSINQTRNRMVFAGINTWACHKTLFHHIVPCFVALPLGLVPRCTSDVLILSETYTMQYDREDGEGRR